MEDLRINVMTAETIAASGDIRKTSNIYYEIDCTGKRIAVLAIALFSLDGDTSKMKNYDNPKFTYIPPESNGERLMQMVCAKPWKK